MAAAAYKEDKVSSRAPQFMALLVGKDLGSEKLKGAVQSILQEYRL